MHASLNSSSYAWTARNFAYALSSNGHIVGYQGITIQSVDSVSPENLWRYWMRISVLYLFIGEKRLFISSSAESPIIHRLPQDREVMVEFPLTKSKPFHWSHFGSCGAHLETPLTARRVNLFISFKLPRPNWQELHVRQSLLLGV